MMVYKATESIKSYMGRYDMGRRGVSVVAEQRHQEASFKIRPSHHLLLAIKRNNIYLQQDDE